MEHIKHTDLKQLQINGTPKVAPMGRSGEIRVIRFCYRKIIDAGSQGRWEKLVFDSTYKEFQMQSQFYNRQKQSHTFAELLKNVPGSEKLHFLVSASMTGYLRQLGGKIPGILNSLGKHFLGFENYQFEIIDSSNNNKSIHKIAISFFSDEWAWHDTIGNNLLLSKLNHKPGEDGLLTELVSLQPFFSIYSVKKITL